MTLRTASLDRLARSAHARVVLRWRRRTHIPVRIATAPLRLRPSAFIVGAQKSGTSSLHAHLSAHPQVGASRYKELGYFAHQYHRSEHWYRANFPLRPVMGRSVGLESTPSYLFHPKAPDRLYRFEPEARLLVLLRDPVDRAFSHYRHMVRMGVEALDFEAAIAAEDGRIESGRRRVAAGLDPDRAYRRFSYVARGHYAEQLDRWGMLFPRDHMLIIRSEDLFADPASVVSRTAAFLGLDEDGLPSEFKKVNSGTPGAMSARTRRDLEEVFRTPNRALAERYGVEFGSAS